jgi:predicted transcriptional regulator
MRRTTISLPDDLRKRLRFIAAERGVSMATVIREAVEKEAAQHRPKPKSIGIADSGHTDTSRLASEGRTPPRSWH